jgi:HD-like signal output (HDOD) protein
MTEFSFAKSSVRDNQDLHMRILTDVAQDLSGEVSFPTTLDLAIKMRNAFKKSGVTLEEFERIVAMEPIIASKLLRLANSSSFNKTGETVSDLRSAIERLGLERARAVSLAVAMDQIMKSKNLAAFDKFAKLNWEHSIRCAVLARTLARHIGRMDPEEAMLAGLVHDIGIYYLFYRASQYSEYRDDHRALIELVLGWHEAVGQAVLDALGLPETITEAVRDHDNLRITDREPRNLNDIVYVANVLVGSKWEWLPHSTTPEQLQAMEKTRQRYAYLLPEAENEIEKLHAALDDHESGP